MHFKKNRNSKEAFKDNPTYLFESLGDVNLKGKGKIVEMFGINKNSAKA